MTDKKEEELLLVAFPDNHGSLQRQREIYRGCKEIISFEEGLPFLIFVEGSKRGPVNEKSLDKYMAEGQVYYDNSKNWYYWDPVKMPKAAERCWGTKLAASERLLQEYIDKPYILFLGMEKNDLDMSSTNEYFRRKTEFTKQIGSRVISFFKKHPCPNFSGEDLLKFEERIREMGTYGSEKLEHLESFSRELEAACKLVTLLSKPEDTEDQEISDILDNFLTENAELLKKIEESNQSRGESDKDLVPYIMGNMKKYNIPVALLIAGASHCSNVEKYARAYENFRVKIKR